MSDRKSISDILNTISITHKFDKDKLIFLNTSDVLEGEILTNAYIPIDKLKGQAKKTIQNGDILFSEIRPKNKRYAYVDVDNPEDYVVSTKLMVLRNKTSFVLTEYIYYFLTYDGTLDYLQMRAENRIGSFPQITFDVLKPISVNIPSLPEQKKITDVISCIDKKIKVNNRINAELESLAKTIYDYWFVQFDFPYDFDRSQPDEHGKPYKSSGGEMVWSDVLDREIPAGWKIGTLHDLGNIAGGSTPSTNNPLNFCKNGIAWITPKDLSRNTGNKFINKGELDVTRAGMKEASLKIYPKGTILLSSRAPIGYMAIARNDFTTNQGFKSFIPNKGFSTPFIYYSVKNSMQAIMQNASGSTFKEISLTSLKENIHVCLPSNIIIDSYTEIVTPIFRQQDILEQENQQLTQLRDWLLPMLMNGQVRVK